MDMTTRQFIDIDVIFMNYKAGMGTSKPKIKLEEIRVIDMDNCDSNCIQTRFTNTARGKFLCGLFNWYIQRMKGFVQFYPNKQLRVMHWGVKSGSEDAFKFNGVFYPELAYTNDSINEYWFCAKLDKMDEHLIMEFKSENKVETSPAEIRSGNTEARKFLRERRKSDCSPIAEDPEESEFFNDFGFHSSGTKTVREKPVISDNFRDTSLIDDGILPDLPDFSTPSKIQGTPSRVRTFDYFSESPEKSYREFSRFLRYPSYEDDVNSTALDDILYPNGQEDDLENDRSWCEVFYGGCMKFRRSKC